jgi:hypothetical protein
MFTLIRLILKIVSGNIILPIIAIVISNNAKADSWTVIQTTTINLNQLSVTQNATNDSTQAVNHINLNMANGEIRAEQNFNGGGQNIVFQQNNSTQSSKQAINRISANRVISATQTVSGIGTVNFTQNGGNNNTQALNETKADQIEQLSQTITGNTINFNQDNVSTGNIQAGNLIQTDSFTAGGINQSLNVDTINFTVNGNSVQNRNTNIQAANVMITSSGNSNDVTQTTIANTVTPSSSNNPQALNYFKVQ